MKSIVVFCGSKPGLHPSYLADAKALGKLLALQNITLIYGGGGVGIMGAVADAALENGGNVTGVIPELLLAWEAQHLYITELIVVKDMHERKKKLYQLADACIILPGGYGTLDEMFEMLTWNNLQIHDKPIFILNTNGFYNHLLAHLQQMQTDGFLYSVIEKSVTVLSEPATLLPYL